MMMYRWMEPQMARLFLVGSITLPVVGVAIMKGMI